ncbi:ATP-dependent RNA helicase-like protein rok1 [Dendryphion nanum]|uniref:ATP-dependent RNA helicase ROK1 n=1 Tax=Dendryphion nanum TaxID=256645 RepID=A0A9P9D4C9_9PLEO|nr:ATP-dependent RNA helicase-like protein rok1 [Dendryphion nanum]
MNVFKLLSRSSKGSQPIPAQKLPSSGAVANPQLFGHEGSHTTSHTSGRNRKRKRGLDAGDKSSTVPADIDFFGGGLRDTSKTRNLEPHGAGSDEEPVVEETLDDGISEGVEDHEMSPYDEDECKRVLRSHKLKVVVLEEFAPAKEEPKKEEKKKKSKRRRREEEEAGKAKKNSKRQLYPVPLTTFAQLRVQYGISRRLAENIAEQGYKLPTEVQLSALPLLLKVKKSQPIESIPNASGADLAGNIDLLTIAPTGSGKTIAFLIPIINSVLSEDKDKADYAEGPRAVIVAPTKELASQIVNEARKLAKGTGIKAALVKKGVEVVERPAEHYSEEDVAPAEAPEGFGDSQSESEKETNAQKPKRRRRKAERVKAAILVATPLALVNALKRWDGSISELSSIRHLVLDEADVLLDPLFREQTLQIWNACSNPLLRVGLWSATMGSNVETLLVETLNTRWQSLPSRSSLPPRPALVRLVVGLKDSAIPNITHQLTYAATEQGKLLGLRQLLHPTAPSADAAVSLRPPFLVFTQTIARAIALHSELRYDIPPEAGGSSRIAVLHADLSSSAREGIMTRFRRGEVWVLITTDLLARGVDFRGLNGVVNYDVPNSAAAYVHRVGRTGRAGRQGGVAVTFYTQEDIPYIKNVANVIRASEKLRGKGEGEGTVKQWLIDALPTPSKRDKQQLKRKGVEARRTVKDADGRNKNRISTKSGYDRKIENRIRGAKMASKRSEMQQERVVEDAGESEFSGFED